MTDKLELNMNAYLPLRDVVFHTLREAILKGELKPGERLPTIRALAEEAGINMMTASKAYQLLKAEGYITTGRRDGAVVRLPEAGAEPETLEGLRLRLCELRLAGLGRAEILDLCGRLYDEEVSER